MGIMARMMCILELIRLGICLVNRSFVYPVQTHMVITFSAIASGRLWNKDVLTSSFYKPKTCTGRL